MDQLNDNWKHHPEHINYYFERDTTKLFNINTGIYITANPIINKK